MADKLVHILNTSNQIRNNSLCGLRGGTVYDPTKSNCKDCLERFKQLYPGSFEAWLRKSAPNAKGKG